MFFDKAQIEQIKQSIDLPAVLMPFVQLKLIGDKYIGLCPFHQEKTGSFYVFLKTNTYHCFGCGTHGNGISFLMQHENYSYVQALEHFAGKAGIKIEKKFKKKQLEQAPILEILEQSNRFFQKKLADQPDTSFVKEYLQKRGFDQKIIKRFEIGYAPSSWDQLTQELTRKQYKKDDLMKSGVLKSKNDHSLYDFYRDRLIFPIRNQKDELSGFAGRQLSEENRPKYINPPDAPHYNKSKLFYATPLAQEAIRKKKRIIIVEGYTDVIRMHQYDYEETVACCGTSLTKDHLLVLKQFYADRIYLLFDGDEAGKKAAFRSAKLFLTENMQCFVVNLPQNLDPDEILSSNQKTLLEDALQKAPHQEEFILQYQSKEQDQLSVQDKNSHIQELLELALDFKDSLQIQLWLKKIADEFVGVSVSALKKKLADLYSKKKTYGVNQDSDDEHQENHLLILQKEYRKYKIEYALVADLLNHPDIFLLVKKIIKPEHFQSSRLKSLFKRLYQFNDEEFQSLTMNQLIDIFPEYAHLFHFLLHLPENKYHQIEFDYQFFKHRLLEFLEKSIYAHYKILFQDALDNERQEELYLQRKKELTELELINLNEHQ